MAIDELDKDKPNPARPDVYDAVRSRVLNLRPADVGVEPSSEMPRVWGVLMDVASSELVWTLVATADGTTSLYMGNGAAIIGAGEYRAVVEARQSLISLAQEFDSALKPADAFPLPQPGRVRFYLLTFDGIRTGEASQKILEETHHLLTPLFKKSHEVVAAVRVCHSRAPASRFTRKDNILQAIMIGVCLLLGMVVGPLLIEARLPGIVMGGFIGMIVGFLGSGAFLMVARAPPREGRLVDESPRRL